MNSFVVFAITIFLVGFVVLVVYSVITLIQIKHTAKQAEEFFKKINKNLENVADIGDKLTSGINTILPFIVSFITLGFSGLTNLLKNLFFRRKK
ncbi:MAG: hypothetical protein ACK4WJ_03130 [Endomicrobiia bacterium]